MRAFTCPVCRHLVAFENTQCLNCATLLAFDWDARTIDRLGYGCANRDLIGCNGTADPGRLCTACALTRTRPPDQAVIQWSVAEVAKRRLVFEVLELGLPIDGGLTFDMLSSAHAPVVTGHADGVITLDLAETDPVHREQTRTELDEPYRTVLGHLRHEIGHYYWDRLVDGTVLLEGFRALFGDERADYEEALEHHYAFGAPAQWGESFISAYASMHPWEDWAETWAHYLHMVDTLETARSHGLTVRAPANERVSTDRLGFFDFDALTTGWNALTLALNSLNRSMGMKDAYPFVLSPKVLGKLRFVHELIQRQRKEESPNVQAA